MGLYLNAICKEMDCACAWWNKTKNQWEYRKVTPISKEKCQEIIESHRNGQKPPVLNEIIVNEDVYTPEETAKIKAFYSLKEEVEQIEARVKKESLEILKSAGAKTMENDDFKISLVEAHHKQVVDTEKLKADGLYDQYTKMSLVKEGIRITHKWQKV